MEKYELKIRGGEKQTFEQMRIMSNQFIKRQKKIHDIALKNKVEISDYEKAYEIIFSAFNFANVVQL